MDDLTDEAVLARLTDYIESHGNALNASTLATYLSGYCANDRPVLAQILTLIGNAE